MRSVKLGDLAPSCGLSASPTPAAAGPPGPRWPSGRPDRLCSDPQLRRSGIGLKRRRDRVKRKKRNHRKPREGTITAYYYQICIFLPLINKRKVCVCAVFNLKYTSRVGLLVKNSCINTTIFFKVCFCSFFCGFFFFGAVSHPLLQGK